MKYYLCVLDFEATCWKDSANKEKMEIIEFPSVLYEIDEENDTYTFISEFSEYVKPTIETKLTDFCTELTGITQSTVDSAETIDIVYNKHIKWLNQNVPVGSEFIIATCGNWDLKTQLPREIKNKKLKKHKYYKCFINVKDEFNYYYKVKSHGMLDMLNFFNLQLIGRHHSGIDDTRNIARIMLQTIKDGHTFNNFQFNYIN